MLWFAWQEEEDEARGRRSSRNSQTEAQNWYGLDLLWAYMQDDPSIVRDVDLVEGAIRKIIALFKASAEAATQRRRFLALCVNNLETNTSSACSLKLLQRIIDTFPRVSRHSWRSHFLIYMQLTHCSTLTQTQKSYWGFSRDRDNVWSIIESLQRRGKRLLDSFFNDLQYYHQAMRSKVEVAAAAARAHADDSGTSAGSAAGGAGAGAGARPTVAASDASASRLPVWLRSKEDFPVDVELVKVDGSAYTHLQQIEARLDFLE